MAETLGKGKSEMQIVKLSLSIVIVLVIMAGVPALPAARNDGQIAPAQTADRAEENYAAVIDMVMPGGETQFDSFPKNVKWIVTVRILPPFERPEYLFSMQRSYDGKVEVSATKTKGDSILTQLQTLKRKHPDKSLETISTLVSLDKLKLTQTEKPQFTRLANEFEAISMSPALPDELRVDDTGYEFWSQSQWGNKMRVTLGGPGPAARKQPHPLLKWAESVRNAIER